jgi:hypothetical protein
MGADPGDLRALLGIFTRSLEDRGSAEMSDLVLSRILRDREIA